MDAIRCRSPARSRARDACSTTASSPGAGFRASCSTTSTAAPTRRRRCARTWRPRARAAPPGRDARRLDPGDRRTEVARPAARSLPVILAPVGLGGMFAQRAEVQAARAAEAAGVPFVESTVSICSIEEVARGHLGAAVVPALRDARSRLRRGADGARASRRLAGAGADDRSRGRRGPPPRHPQRDRGSPSTWAKARRGLDLVCHPRWIRDVPIGGKPLTFGNLENAVPGARTPDAFRQWVDAQFDPSVTWDDIAWVREHWNGRLRRQGRARSRGRPPCRRGRRRRGRRLQPRRAPARLGAVDRAGAARDRRGGRRRRRGAGRRRRPHRPRRRQDDRARRPRGPDRPRVGVGSCRARASAVCVTCSR